MPPALTAHRDVQCVINSEYAKLALDESQLLGLLQRRAQLTTNGLEIPKYHRLGELQNTNQTRLHLTARFHRLLVTPSLDRRFSSYRGA